MIERTFDVRIDHPFLLIRWAGDCEDTLNGIMASPAGTETV
jgi:hypothetical protein